MTLKSSRASLAGSAISGGAFGARHALDGPVAALRNHLRPSYFSPATPFLAWMLPERDP